MSRNCGHPQFRHYVKNLLVLFMKFFFLIIVIQHLLRLNLLSFHFTNKYGDSILIQGMEYDIILDIKEYELLKNYSSKRIFLTTFFFYYNDDRYFDYQIKELYFDQKKRVYYTNLSIPKMTNRILFSLYDSISCLGYRFSYSVYDKSKKLAKGALTTIVYNSNDVHKIDSLVEFEQAYYEDNVSVLPIKWRRKLELFSLKTVEIQKDIEKIYELNINEKDKILPLLLGYTFIKDSIYVSYYLQKLYSIYNLPILNNEYVVSFFDNLIEKGVYEKYLLKDELKCRIIYNNPTSLFTYYNLLNGFIARQYKKYPEASYQLIKLRLSLNSHSIIDKLALSELFSKCYPDSLQIASQLCQEMIDNLYDVNYYTNGYDPLNHLHTFSRIIWSEASFIEFKKGNLRNSVDILLNASRFYKPFDFYQCQIYYTIANYFDSYFNRDSSLFYYFYTLKICPDFKPAEQELMKYHKMNINDSIDFFSWLDNSLVNFEIKRIKLDVSAPEIDTDSGKYFLYNPIRSLILEFYTKNCPYCISNLKLLNTLKLRDKYDIIIITNDDFNNTKSLLNRLNIYYPIAVNSSELIEFFGIKIYPETIIINNLGEIVYKLTGTIPNKFLLLND